MNIAKKMGENIQKKKIKQTAVLITNLVTFVGSNVSMHKVFFFITYIIRDSIVSFSSTAQNSVLALEPKKETI